MERERKRDSNPRPFSASDGDENAWRTSLINGDLNPSSTCTVLEKYLKRYPFVAFPTSTHIVSTHRRFSKCVPRSIGCKGRLRFCRKTSSTRKKSRVYSVAIRRVRNAKWTTKTRAKAKTMTTSMIFSCTFAILCILNVIESVLAA